MLPLQNILITQPRRTFKPFQPFILMPHDKNGKEVFPGDLIFVPARVISVSPGNDYCNLNLETVEKMFPSDTTNTMTLNTRQVIVAESLPPSDTDALAEKIAASIIKILDKEQSATEAAVSASPEVNRTVQMLEQIQASPKLHEPSDVPPSDPKQAEPVVSNSPSTIQVPEQPQPFQPHLRREADLPIV